MSDAEFIKKLEERGEAGVAKDLAKGLYVEQRARVAKHWLDNQQRAREEGRRDTEVDAATRANEIAERANEHADKANRIAIGAMCVAATAVIISVIALIKA